VASVVIILGKLAPSGIIGRIISWVYSKVMLSFFFRLLIESYIEISLCAFLNVQNFIWDTSLSGEFQSSLASSCFFFLVAVYPVYIVAFIVKN
jgi:hypothetical protein